MPLLQRNQILGYLFKSLPVSAEANANQYQREITKNKTAERQHAWHILSLMHSPVAYSKGTHLILS